MIQAGHNLKYNHIMDWKDRLIINWSDNEKNQLREWLKTCGDIRAKQIPKGKGLPFSTAA